MLYEMKPNYGTPFFFATNKRHGKYIIIRHSHIAILDFELEENAEFISSMCTFDKIYFREDLKGGYYSRELKEFRIPRGYPVKLLKQFFPRHKIFYDFNHYHFDNIEIKLLLKPHTDIQKICLAHAIGEGPYREMGKEHVQIINMDTGDGKTYMMAALTAFFRSKSIIFLPLDKLFNQTIDSFEKFTSIKKNDIAVIKGTKSMRKLLANRYADKKVFLISVTTFSTFVENEGLMNSVLALQNTRAHTCFIDEIHLEMNAIMKIIASSNFAKNYYMTSSFGKSDKHENRIFKSLFYFTPKIGKELKHEVEKHIQVNVGYYKYQPTQIETMKIWKPRIGLNSKAYEKMLFDGDGKRKLIPALHQVIEVCMMMEEGGKYLLLAATIDGAEKLAKIMKVLKPDSKIMVYHSKISKKEKEAIDKADIICSTVDSLGTGADIKGLQFVISIVTYSNAIWADQIPGRLRKSNFKNLLYWELVNKGYKKTHQQWQKRMPELAKKSIDKRIGELD